MKSQILNQFKVELDSGMESVILFNNGTSNVIGHSQFSLKYEGYAGIYIRELGDERKRAFDLFSWFRDAIANEPQKIKFFLNKG